MQYNICLMIHAAKVINITSSSAGWDIDPYNVLLRAEIYWRDVLLPWWWAYSINPQNIEPINLMSLHTTNLMAYRSEGVNLKCISLGFVGASSVLCRTANFTLSWCDIFC